MGSSSKDFTCAGTHFKYLTTKKAKMKTTLFWILIVALMTADAAPFGIGIPQLTKPGLKEHGKKQICCWSSNCWSRLIDRKQGNYKSWNKCCCFRFKDKIGSPSLPFYCWSATQSLE